VHLSRFHPSSWPGMLLRVHRRCRMELRAHGCGCGAFGGEFGMQLNGSHHSRVENAMGNVPAVALQTVAFAGGGQRSAPVCESLLALLWVCEGYSVRSPAPAGRRRKLRRTGSVGTNAAKMFSPVFLPNKPFRKKCITCRGRSVRDGEFRQFRSRQHRARGFLAKYRLDSRQGSHPKSVFRGRRSASIPSMIEFCYG
jgi:hypothetical protein